ncbi:hypothetical protein GGX14DRAFT_567767 [Mycena pura]|uniref:Uncharacterized protein n=1 Tax=Mycena pura TaxID=153505 RepID=A0AAD6VA42_9AGAR|nr:hypothetical protein GGX14DRAFT_567767 [Mycena pura]
MSSPIIAPFTTPLRPSFGRSQTLTSEPRTLASFLSSPSKGLRRLSDVRHRKHTDASSATVRPSALSQDDGGVEPFISMDIEQRTPSRVPPQEASPLRPAPRPTIQRSMTLPAAVRAMRSKALDKLPAKTTRKAGLSRAPPKSPKSSADSFESSSSIRTHSSVSSLASFSSTEETVTLRLRVLAFPVSMLGLLTSIVCVALIFLLPILCAPTPKRKSTPRPYEQEIVVTEEQGATRFPSLLSMSLIVTAAERSPPRLLRFTLRSRLTRRLTTHTSKGLHAVKPTPVDPKTLLCACEVLFVGYESPIVLPLTKGPAPAVQPACKRRELATLLSTVREDEREHLYADGVLCAGW